MPKTALQEAIDAVEQAKLESDRCWKHYCNARDERDMGRRYGMLMYWKQKLAAADEELQRTFEKLLVAGWKRGAALEPPCKS